MVYGRGRLLRRPLASSLRLMSSKCSGLQRYLNPYPILFLIVFFAVLRISGIAETGSNDLLQPVGSIALEGIEGRIDHMAASPDGRWLFVAALGSNQVEIIDTDCRMIITSLKGIKEPQGLYYLARLKRLAVASGGAGKLYLYDGKWLRVATIGAVQDADNLRYDASTGLLYLGYGQGALAIIDPRRGSKIGEIMLDGHPESFQLESNSRRIFVNVPKATEIEVVDRERRSILAKWKLREGAAANFPMALDERHQRLFIGLRHPPRLYVLDTESGRVIAEVPACGDSDDLFYNSITQQIYLSGGAGCVSVFQQNNADHYDRLLTLNTPRRSRTSLYVSSTHTLYVAVPHQRNQQAEIRMFNTKHIP